MPLTARSGEHTSLTRLSRSSLLRSPSLNLSFRQSTIHVWQVISTRPTESTAKGLTRWPVRLVCWHTHLAPTKQICPLFLASSRNVTLLGTRRLRTLGCGRLAAERGDVEHAHLFLFEALDYAQECGYALYEADGHLNLALAYGRAGDAELSGSESSRAIGLCESIDYWWGTRAAEAIRSGPDVEG